MSITGISNSNSSIYSTESQESKTTGAGSAGNADKTASINYSTASIPELEELAAKGDAQAQNELAKRKASEQQSSTASLLTGSTLNIEG